MTAPARCGEAVGQRYTGRIRVFDPSRDFGWISSDALDRAVFAGGAMLRRGGLYDPRPGEFVSFHLRIKPDRAPEAIDIEVQFG
jgi:cold shock CspA family protein